MAQIVGLTKQQIYQKAYSQIASEINEKSARFNEYVDQMVNPKRTFFGYASLPLKFVYDLVHGGVQSAVSFAYAMGAVFQNARNDLRHVIEASKSGDDVNKELNFMMGNIALTLSEGMAQWGVSTAANLGRAVFIDPKWAFGENGVSQKIANKFTQERGEALGMDSENLDLIRNAVDDRYYDDIKKEILSSAVFKRQVDTVIENVLKSAYNTKTYGFKNEVSAELADKQFGNEEWYQGISGAVNSIGSILMAQAIGKVGAKTGMSAKSVQAITQTYFAANVFGNAYEMALNNGASLQDAYTYAMGNALMETAIENLGGNTPEKLIQTSTWKEMLKSGAEEGFEELMSEYGSTSFEQYLNPEKKINAPKMGTGQFATRAFFSFMGGALAAAGLGVGNNLAINGTVEGNVGKLSASFDQSIAKVGEERAVSNMNKSLDDMISVLNRKDSKGIRTNDAGGTYTAVLTLNEKKKMLEKTGLDTYIYEDNGVFKRTEAAKVIDKTMFDNYIYKDGKRVKINSDEYAMNTNVRATDISENGVRKVLKKSELNDDGSRLLRIAKEMRVAVAVISGDQGTSGIYGKKSNILYLNQNAVADMTDSQIRDVLIRHEIAHKIANKSKQDYETIKRQIDSIISIDLDPVSGNLNVQVQSEQIKRYLEKTGYFKQIQAAFKDYYEQIRYNRYKSDKKDNSDQSRSEDMQKAFEYTREEIVAYFIENVFSDAGFVNAISDTKSGFFESMRQKFENRGRLKQIADGNSRLFRLLTDVQKSFNQATENIAVREATMGYLLSDILNKKYSLSNVFNKELVEKYGLQTIIDAIANADKTNQTVTLGDEVYDMIEIMDDNFLFNSVDTKRLSQEAIDEAVKNFVFDMSKKQTYANKINAYVIMNIEARDEVIQKLKVIDPKNAKEVKRFRELRSEYTENMERANDILDEIEDIYIKHGTGQDGNKYKLIIGVDLMEDEIELLAEIIATVDEAEEEERRQNAFNETVEMRVIRNAVQNFVKYFNTKTKLWDKENNVKWQNRARSANGGAVLIKEVVNPYGDQLQEYAARVEMNAFSGIVSLVVGYEWPNRFEVSSRVLDGGKSVEYVVFPTDDYVTDMVAKMDEIEKGRAERRAKRAERRLERKTVEKTGTMKDVVQNAVKSISELLGRINVDLKAVKIINLNPTYGDFLNELKELGYTDIVTLDGELALKEYSENPSNFQKNQIVIGIPLFSGNNVSDSINSALKTAETVAFIVPITWDKSLTNQNLITSDSSLVLSERIGMQSFKIGEKAQPIKVALQVWTRLGSDLDIASKNLRQVEGRKERHPDFETKTLVGMKDRYEALRDWRFDFAVPSQGNGIDFTQKFRRFEELKPTGKYILVRVNQKNVIFAEDQKRVIDTFDKIDFDELALMGSNIHHGFTTADLVEAYEKVQAENVGTREYVSTEPVEENDVEEEIEVKRLSDQSVHMWDGDRRYSITHYRESDKKFGLLNTVTARSGKSYIKAIENPVGSQSDYTIVDYVISDKDIADEKNIVGNLARFFVSNLDGIVEVYANGIGQVKAFMKLGFFKGDGFNTFAEAKELLKTEPRIRLYMKPDFLSDSGKKDNQGHALTTAQKEYFENTSEKLRDENGDLKVLYRSNVSYFISEDPEILLKLDRELAEMYSAKDYDDIDIPHMVYAKAPRVITHPFNAWVKYTDKDYDRIVRLWLEAIDEKTLPEKIAEEMYEREYDDPKVQNLAEALEAYAKSSEDANRSEDERLVGQKPDGISWGQWYYEHYQSADKEYSKVEYHKAFVDHLSVTLKKKGYDGIEIFEGVEDDIIPERSGSGKALRSFLIFNENNVRSIAEKNPYINPVSVKRLNKDTIVNVDGGFQFSVKQSVETIADQNANIVNIGSDGSFIELWLNSPYTPADHSIVEFSVPEEKRGNGIGTALVRAALGMNFGGVISAQASSIGSVIALYRNGFRSGNDAFEETLNKFNQYSSVYMEYDTNQKPIDIKRVRKTHPLTQNNIDLLKKVLGAEDPFIRDFFELDANYNVVVKNDRINKARKVKETIQMKDSKKNITQYSAKDYAIHTFVDVSGYVINDGDAPIKIEELTDREKVFFDVLSTTNISFVLFKSDKAKMSGAMGYSIPLPTWVYAGNPTPVLFIDLAYFNDGLEVEMLSEVATHEMFHEAFKFNPLLAYRFASSLSKLLFTVDANGKAQPTAVYTAFDRKYGNGFLKYLHHGYGSGQNNRHGYFETVKTIQDLYDTMKIAETKHDGNLSDFLNEVGAQIVGKLMSSRAVFETIFGAKSADAISFYELFEQVLNIGNVDANTRRIIDETKKNYADVINQHIEILLNRFPSEKKYDLASLNDFINNFTDGQFKTRNQLITEYMKERTQKVRGDASVVIDNIIYLASIYGKTVQAASTSYAELSRIFNSFKTAIDTLIEHPEKTYILFEKRTFDFGTFKYKGTIFDLFNEIFKYNKYFMEELDAGTVTLSISYFETVREMVQQFLDAYADIDDDVIDMFGLPAYVDVETAVANIDNEANNMIDTITQVISTMTPDDADRYLAGFKSQSLHNMNSATEAMERDLRAIRAAKKVIHEGKDNLKVKLLEAQKQSRLTFIKNLVLTIRTRLENTVRRYTSGGRSAESPIDTEMKQIIKLVNAMADMIEKNPFSAVVESIPSPKVRIASDVVAIVNQIREIVNKSTALPDDVKESLIPSFVAVYGNLSSLFNDKSILIDAFTDPQTGKLFDDSLALVKINFNEKTLASALMRVIIAFEKKYTSTFNDSLTLDEYAEMTVRQIGNLAGGNEVDGSFMGGAFTRDIITPQDFFLAYSEMIGRNGTNKVRFFDDFFEQYKNAAHNRGRIMMEFEKSYGAFKESTPEGQKASLENTTPDGKPLELSPLFAIEIRLEQYNKIIEKIDATLRNLKDQTKEGESELASIKSSLLVLNNEINLLREHLKGLKKSDPEYAKTQSEIEKINRQKRPLLDRRSAIRAIRQKARADVKAFDRTRMIQDALIEYAKDNKTDQTITYGEVCALYMSIKREVEMREMVENGTEVDIFPTDHFGFGNQFHVLSATDLKRKNYKYASTHSRQFTMFVSDKYKALEYLESLLRPIDKKNIEFARNQFDKNYEEANAIFKAKYQVDLPRQKNYIPFATPEANYDRELELRIMNRKNIGAKDSLVTATTLGATAPLRIENVFSVVENSTKVTANYSFERVITDWQNLLINKAGGRNTLQILLQGKGSVLGTDNGIIEMIESMFKNVLQYSNLDETKAEKIVKKHLRKMVGATMALNIASMVKQLASISTIALKNKLNFGKLMKNVAKALASNSKYRKWLMEHNENFYHRAKQGNIVYLAEEVAPTVIGGVEDTFDKVTNVLSRHIGWFDNSVLVGAFETMYEELYAIKHEYYTEEQLLEETNRNFEEVLLYGVANTDPAFRASFSNNKNVFVRMASKFQSENVLQVSAQIRNVVLFKNKTGRAKYFGRRDFLAWLLSGIFTAIVTKAFSRGRGYTEEHPYFDFFINDVLWSNLAGSIPYVNMALSALEFDPKTVIKGGFPQEVPIFSELYKVAETIGTMGNGENIPRKALKVLEYTGQVFGVPIKNAVRMFQTTSYILSESGSDLGADLNDFFRMQSAQQGFSAAVKTRSVKAIESYVTDFYQNGTVKREVYKLMADNPEETLNVRAVTSFKKKQKDGTYKTYTIPEGLNRRFNAVSQAAIAGLIATSDYRTLPPKERIKAIQRVVNYYYNFIKLKVSDKEYYAKQPMTEAEVIQQALRYADKTNA